MPYAVSKYVIQPLALLLCCGLPHMAIAHEVEDIRKPDTSSMTYKTVVNGAPEGMEQELKALTETFQQQDNPPPTLYLLYKRLEADETVLLKALQAKSYYDAEVESQVITEVNPLEATFDITPGTPYILRNIRIMLSEDSRSRDIALPAPESLSLQINAPVQTEQVLKSRVELRNQLFEQNCLRNLTIKPFLRIDRSEKSAEAVYETTTGPTAYFGKLKLDGLQTVKPAYVERMLTWKEGDCYKPSLLEKTQLKLLEGNLFSSSQANVSEEPDENGKVDVTLHLQERAQRTIKAGIGYTSDKGLDFKPAWEHRNFFGEGEKVVVESTLSTFLQSLKGRFERPAFLHPDQTLILESKVSRAETDAYNSIGAGGTASLSRKLSEHVNGGLGIGYTLSEIEDDGDKETFSLVSFPAYLEHSTRNDTLDPTDGHVLRLDATPFVETMEFRDPFLRTAATAKWYHQHEETPLKPTWAFRGVVGSILGSGTGDIPADERFYSGGGGSVRGYGYQMLGPLTGNDPDGGRSLVEVSAELRLRVTETIGIVPFVDAGNVYDSVYPDFNEELFIASGIGFRYYTDFGPFRLDIATPLNGRDGVDDNFQLYISFGQSF